uniref:MFS domain-containing protein n=1 Tax=Macrostomum lignano TaxID=282301 RepID=A0A1I8IG46_9PLAT
CQRNLARPFVVMAGSSSGARLLLSSPKIARSLLSLSMSFLLMFTSYQGLASLQSSINSVGGLGTAGLAVTYACVVPSSLLVSPLALDWLGAKWTMLLGMLGYVIYFLLSLAPGWATIIPGSALLGLCGAPLWAGMSLYTVQLAAIADAEAAADDKGRQNNGDKGGKKVATLPVFFGVFFTIVTSCNIWGNLISYLTLVDRSDGGVSNSTAAISNFSCGYRFCPAKPAAGAEAPTSDAEVEALGPGGLPAVKFYTLMSCFIATAVVSVLVMFFLVDRNDPPKNEEPVKAGTQQQVSQLLERLRKALAQLVDPRQLLLVPLTINAGLSQAFSLGDFTEGFVACTSGIASVGLVMISYGVSQVVTGLLAGQAAARVGPAPVLLSALMGLLAMEVGSLFWEVLPQPEWPLHGMAVAWGAVDSVWVTLLN